MPKLRTASSPRRRRWKIADARSVFAALDASGLSLADFARREGLKLPRLRRWRHRLHAHEKRRQVAAPELIEIRPRRAEPVEIVLASGRVLRVAETIDASALARLVAALERP
jgi:hypothetical protein